MSQPSRFDAQPFRLPPLDAFGYLVEARFAPHRRPSHCEAPEGPDEALPRVEVLGPRPGLLSRLVKLLGRIQLSLSYATASGRP